MKDLPKTVPAAFLAATQDLVTEVRAAGTARSNAQLTYGGGPYQALVAEQRGHRMYAEHHAMAAALVSWGETVRGALLQQPGLVDLVETRDLLPCLTIIEREIHLCGDLEGHRLRNRLRLALDTDRGLFGLEVWFDGILMIGKRLNSEADVANEMLPEMLRQIHDRLADEEIWQSLIHSVSKLDNVRNDR